MIFRKCFWGYENILYFISSQAYKKAKMPPLPLISNFPTYENSSLLHTKQMLLIWNNQINVY